MSANAAQEESQDQITGDEANNTDPNIEDYEDKAKAVGWEPLENFRGDPEKHIDAKTFLDRAQSNMGLLKSNNQKLYDANDELKRDIDELKKSTRAILDHNKQAVKNAEIKAYEKAKNDLIRAQREAVENGDTKEFDRIEAEKDNLEKPKVEDNQPNDENQQSASTDYQEFVTNNKWYEQDSDLQALANSVGDQLRQQGDRREGKSFFDAVADRVKSIRPDKFSNPARDMPSTVNEAGSNVSQSSKTYSSLPKEAKDAFQSLVRQNIFTKDEADQYAKDYYGV